MSCSRSEVELEVLERLKPTSLQLRVLRRFYELLRGMLVDCLSGRFQDVEVEAHGSFAKKTILSDRWEVDIFVLFNGVTRDWVRRESLRVLEECIRPLPYTVKYAEHPYLTVNMMGLKAEVVPAVKVEKPGSGGLGVERTPFHTRYVKAKLEERPCLADDVRLLKSFMEGIGVYGAETGIGGFSGYLAELLVIHYGGFRETLVESSKWRPQVYIDPEGVGNEAKLRSKYRDSPIIVVDPVDPDRNAAASVTKEKLALFILASNLYLRSPHPGYFHITGSGGVEASGPALMVVCRGDYIREPEESILGKLRRVALLISSTLRDRGFRVTWFSYASDFVERAVALVGLESLELPELEYRRGLRPWDDIEGAVRFLLKRFDEGGVVWVNEEGFLDGIRHRPYRWARKVVEEMLGRVAEVLDASSCEVLECRDGAECIRVSGLGRGSFVGGPYAWMRLAYNLLKHS